MSHHSEKPDFSIDEINRLLAGEPKAGATGNYPHGKLNEHDEGEILIRIAAWPEKGVVIVDFGKPVHSIGFTAEQATELAEMFHAKAWELRGIKPT